MSTWKSLIEFISFLKDQAVLFQIIESLFVILAGSIALLTYLSQVRQNKIANAYLLVKKFYENVSPSDMQLLHDIYINTYEGTGVTPGYFSYWRANQFCQQPIAELFGPEGRGSLLPSASLIPKPENALEVDRDIDLSAIRKIANQLEALSYEALFGQVEHRVIFYEFGRTLEIIKILLISSLNEEDRYNLKQRYKNVLKFSRRIESQKLPKLLDIEFD